MTETRKTSSRFLAAGAACVLTAAFAFSPAHAQAAGDVTATIAALDQALDKIQKSDSGSFDARAQSLAPTIDQTYDLEAVLRSSVGASRYSQLSSDDKQALLTAFRQYTIARYLSNFKKGSDAQFTLAPGSRNSPVGNDKIVTTHIGSADNMPGTEVDYILRQEGNGWKIVDVLLEGHISQAAAQRSDFGSTLSSGGVQGLIAILNRKVKNFSEE